MPADSSLTYDLSLLEASAAKWKGSAALRCVYKDIFSDVAFLLREAPTLELGSGIGIIKDFFPHIVTSDVSATRFVDTSVSAYDIAKPDGSAWRNIVAFDVFHHLRQPLKFLASASAAISTGGHIILIEPAGTAWGRFFYRLFHHEPCLPAKVLPPFDFTGEAAGEFSNMGMAYAFFSGKRQEIDSNLATLGLEIERVRYRDILAYPATGGFSKPAILPKMILQIVLAIERCFPQAFLKVVSLRMIVILRKTR